MKNFGTLIIAAAAAAGIAVGGAGAASAANADKVMIENGNYRVGYDVEPGTYRSGGSGHLNIPCSWMRFGLSPSDQLVPLDYGETYNPVTVTIESSDVMFLTQNCGGWTRVDEAAGGSLGSLDFGSLGSGSFGS